MPWYVAKPFSGRWGWHWTMNHFDPDRSTASGDREIASHFYPLIGPYDSADPAVLEYHVLLLKLAGIDGVIVDWYGMDAYLDYGEINERTLLMLHWVHRARLKFSLCYEDRTIQQEIGGGFLQPAAALAHAQDTLRYAESNYFADGSYLQWGGQPVLLNFGPQYFQADGQWPAIFSVLAAKNQPAFFTLDRRLSGGWGGFNWPPMWLSQANGGVLTVSALEEYLATFEANARAWPAFVSSAFPRFKDIYAQAGVGSSYGTLDDNNGDTLRATLSRAMTNGSAIVQLVTWNDFGEGTVLEPTKQLGYRDLGMVQDLRRRHLDPGFKCDTNDLTLAARFYSLRRQYGGSPVLSAELDRVFTQLVAGNLATARLQMSGIESRKPVLYEPGTSAGLMEFKVGGYLSAAGTQVDSADSPLPSQWAVATAFPGSTNLLRFSAPIPAPGDSVFFRARTATP
jgi:hypothetical protein